ncbi:MAG: hypothetical protein A2143_06090 [Gallionellales bacterium RBG_16_57_15]|nr:MAG: hypothetical protein A2143_06090 [Gallionellales bacterium RBG_16_57_15]
MTVLDTGEKLYPDKLGVRLYVPVTRLLKTKLPSGSVTADKPGMLTVTPAKADPLLRMFPKILFGEGLTAKSVKFLAVFAVMLTPVAAV